MQLSGYTITNKGRFTHRQPSQWRGSSSPLRCFELASVSPK